MNEGIHLDLDTWIVPGQIRKANLWRGLGNRNSVLCKQKLDGSSPACCLSSPPCLSCPACCFYIVYIGAPWHCCPGHQPTFITCIGWRTLLYINMRVPYRLLYIMYCVPACIYRWRDITKDHVYIVVLKVRYCGVPHRAPGDVCTACNVHAQFHVLLLYIGVWQCELCSVECLTRRVLNKWLVIVSTIFPQ